jgi:hypothetical protein
MVALAHHHQRVKRLIGQPMDLPLSSSCDGGINSKRNEDEESSEKLYTHVTYVKTDEFKGLETKVRYAALELKFDISSNNYLLDDR